MPAENKDCSRDVVIRVSPGQHSLTMEEHKPGGIVDYKKISPLDFYFAINGSYWSNEMVSSGFLPDNCLHISMDRKEKFFTIWNPELRADVMYQRQTQILKGFVPGVSCPTCRRPVTEQNLSEVQGALQEAIDAIVADGREQRGQLEQLTGCRAELLQCQAQLQAAETALSQPPEDFSGQISQTQQEVKDLKVLISNVVISLYDVMKTTGEQKAAFKFTYNSRRYDRLSLSEKIRAGTEVSELVKRLTGRNYPVFVDNMESVDDLANVRPTGQVIMAKCVRGAGLSSTPGRFGGGKSRQAAPSAATTVRGSIT